MFKKKQQKRMMEVVVTFKHASEYEWETSGALEPEVIDLLPGQRFEQCIGADTIWEGDTVVKQFDWKAGYTKVYEYFYV